MPYTQPALLSGGQALLTFRVPFFLQILDQSFVCFLSTSNAGTLGGGTTASSSVALSCTLGPRGLPARRPRAGRPLPRGLDPWVSVLGWDKGVNIYHFLYLL